MKSLLKIYLFLIVIIPLSIYVIFEVWHVFGWKAITLSIFINSFLGIILRNFIGCRTKIADGYMFNPKELPKYLAMLAATMVGVYLYVQLGNPELSINDWRFGMVWIALVVFLPIAFQVNKLFRDRNDYVKISGHMLTYRDNDHHGEFSLKELKQAEVATGGDVKLVFLDGRERSITTSDMNFGSTELLELVNTINEILPNLDRSV